MNHELIKKIHDIAVVEFPGGESVRREDQFDMLTWESPSECGTTRCIAGWAISLTTNTPLFADGKGGTLGNGLHPSVLALAEELELGPDGEDDDEIIIKVADELLGLDGEVDVFVTSNDEGLEWLKAHSNPEV